MFLILYCPVLNEAGMDQTIVDSKRKMSQTELNGPWLRHRKGLRQKNHQFSSVPQSCLTLCNPMDCSTPGLPVYHQLLEFAQTHRDGVIYDKLLKNID